MSASFPHEVTGLWSPVTSARTVAYGEPQRTIDSRLDRSRNNVIIKAQQTTTHPTEAIMAKQYAFFQTTTFVDTRNGKTFADGTNHPQPTVRSMGELPTLDGRSRFIGVRRNGMVVLDHKSGGNFKRFSENVARFKREEDPAVPLGLT